MEPGHQPLLPPHFGAIGAGILFETELWRRFGHLLEPPRTALSVDGRRVDSYSCAVASTVPLTLLLGLVRAMDRRARPERFEGMVIEETDPLRLVQLIPTLLSGGEHTRVTPLHDAANLALCGPYTLDGERFAHLDSHAPIRVVGSRRVFRGVWVG